MVLLNNLDFGERLGINYKNNGFGLQIFEGNIKLPFIFKSPISVEAGLRLFRRDSSFSNSSQDLNLSYQLNEKFKVQGGIEFINSTSLEPEDFNSSSDVVNFNSTFYSIGFNFLKLNPRQDFNEDTFLNLKGSIGERQSTLNSDQYKLSLTGQHQILLNYRNRIYINLNSQILISDSFINNELFRFGGVNSIRGFSENSLIANRFAVLQTEYRHLLDSNLFANTVIDLGNYENKLDQFSESILGYGIGLGLKSKAGIFKLVLANAVSTDQDATFSNSKIHISFTSIF
jgi:hemolysin activation/secretion protein